MQLGSSLTFKHQVGRVTSWQVDELEQGWKKPNVWQWDEIGVENPRNAFSCNEIKWGNDRSFNKVKKILFFGSYTWSRVLGFLSQQLSFLVVLLLRYCLDNFSRSTSLLPHIIGIFQHQYHLFLSAMGIGVRSLLYTTSRVNQCTPEMLIGLVDRFIEYIHMRSQDLDDFGSHVLRVLSPNLTDPILDLRKGLVWFHHVQPFWACPDGK